MLTFSYNATSVFDGILLYLYYQNLLVKRRTDIPTGLLAAGFVLAELISVFAASLSVRDTSPAAIYFRVGLNAILYFILSFMYTVPLVHRTLVVICYIILGIICADISYYIIYAGTYIDLHVPMKAPAIIIPLLCNLLQFFLIMLLHAFWRRKSGVQSFTYTMLLLLIPALSLFLTLSPLGFLLNMAAPDLYAALVLFLLIINIANYVLLEKVLKAEALEQKAKRLETQITYQRQKYMQLGEAYRNIRSFMHDAKKHLFYIEQCVNDKNYERIIPYSRETIADLESRYCTVNTGNLVIDAFVSNFILQTAQHGIELTTSLKLDNNAIPVDDYHLTIILGNLLDNALNACLRQLGGRINVMIQTVENTFTIYITNTYIILPGEKKADNIEELDFIHGYGLENVKDSVAECGGIMLMDYENTLYSVTIIFPSAALPDTRP